MHFEQASDKTTGNQAKSQATRQTGITDTTGTKINQANQSAVKNQTSGKKMIIFLSGIRHQASITSCTFRPFEKSY